MRAVRRLLALVAVVVLAWAPLAVPASAQLPPEVQSTLQVASPLVAPQCGNAILAMTIVAGTAPVQAQEGLKLATSGIFIACGSIPLAPRAPTHCVDDDVMATVLAQLGGSLIGGALPVGTPGIGQVVDAIDILRSEVDIPADDESLVAMAASALECRFAAAVPPPAPYTPPDDATTFVPPRADVRDGNLTPAGEAPAAGTPIDTGVLGSPSALEAPVVATAATVPEPSRVGYPLFLVPILIAAAAVVVGRGLLAGREV